MRKAVVEFLGPFIRALLRQDLKISECVIAKNAGYVHRVARNDEREEDRHKWITYHRTVRKYRVEVFKTKSSKYRDSS